MERIGRRIRGIAGIRILARADSPTVAMVAPEGSSACAIAALRGPSSRERNITMDSRSWVEPITKVWSANRSIAEPGRPHTARVRQPRRRMRRRARFVVGVEPLWLTPRTVAFAGTDEPYARSYAWIASTGTEGMTS